MQTGIEEEMSAARQRGAVHSEAEILRSKVTVIGARPGGQLAARRGVIGGRGARRDLALDESGQPPGERGELVVEEGANRVDVGHHGDPQSNRGVRLAMKAS